MTATIYTQPTVTSIYVGPTGHQHNKTGAESDYFALDCDACAPFLVREGWVYDTELVPLTDKQIREKDRLEREGNLAVRQAATALSEAATAAVTTANKANSKAAKETRRRTAQPTKQRGPGGRFLPKSRE